MKTIVCVQARMGSKRLPGKVMKILNGRPMIDYLLESVWNVVARSQIYVLTSNEIQNDILVHHMHDLGINVYRGSEDNVASRYAEIIEFIQPENVIRICGDSPFLLSEVVMEVVQLLEQNQCKFASTVLSQCVPSGMHVEGFKAQLFLSEWKKFNTAEHFEHVTKYFYEHLPLESKEVGLSCRALLGNKFSIDTQSDWDFAEQMFTQLGLDRSQQNLIKVLKEGS